MSMNQWPECSIGCACRSSITYFNLLLSASATWTPTRLSAYELSFFTINPKPPHSSQICHHIASSCAVKPAWQVNVTIHDIHISQKLHLCSKESHWPFYYRILNRTGINIKSTTETKNTEVYKIFTQFSQQHFWPFVKLKRVGRWGSRVYL